MDDVIPFGRTWEQPELTSIGRLPMRSPLVPIPDAAAALDEHESSSRFQLIDRPEAAPSGGAQPSHDDADWEAIQVPGCWTRQG